MGFSINSEEPINFPGVCIKCQSESTKTISSDVVIQESSTLLTIINIFNHFDKIKYVGTSVKIPLCQNCFKYIYIFRIALILLAIISGCMMAYGVTNESDYVTVGGIFSLIFWPFLYVHFKDSHTEVVIYKHVDTHMSSKMTTT